MDITEVRVKLCNREDDRLKAYCTVTFDDQFVIREVRVVEGTNGLFVAMPSRKTSTPCPRCSHRNQVQARFCNDCGAKLPPNPPPADNALRTKQHRDIAHPITPDFREMLQQSVLDAYLAEADRAQEPGYQPSPLETEEPITEEPAAMREPETTQVTEYDALIADLRKGAPSSRREPMEREAPPARRPAPRRDSYEDDDRRGNRARPQPRAPQPAPRSADTPRQAPPPVRRPASPPRQPERTPSRSESWSQRQGNVRREEQVPVSRSAPPPLAPPPVAPPMPPPMAPPVQKPRQLINPTPAPPPAPVARPQVEPDADAFGAGIL